MWLSTWLPFVLVLQYVKNRVIVTHFYAYLNDEENSKVELSVQDINNIPDKSHFRRYQVNYTIDQTKFVYTATNDQFLWPLTTCHEKFPWIQKASLCNDDDSGKIIDVTDEVVMYAGQYGDFHNTDFDFNWIPIVKSNMPEYKFLELLDHNDSVYRFALKTNTEIIDKECNKSNIKLYCRSSADFEQI